MQNAKNKLTLKNRDFVQYTFEAFLSIKIKVPHLITVTSL